jgi:hypothetical protein
MQRGGPVMYHEAALDALREEHRQNTAHLVAEVERLTGEVEAAKKRALVAEAGAQQALADVRRIASEQNEIVEKATAELQAKIKLLTKERDAARAAAASGPGGGVPIAPIPPSPSMPIGRSATPQQGQFRAKAKLQAGPWLHYNDQRHVRFVYRSAVGESACEADADGAWRVIGHSGKPLVEGSADGIESAKAACDEAAKNFYALE